MIHFRNLSETKNIDILDCFNLSFSDYSIPFKLQLEQLENKLSTENINKKISIGAFKGDRLIGFVLHGDRKEELSRVAYNAGTGVIPKERGQQLTRRMYDFIKPTLAKNEITEVDLEVISTNAPAIKSYEAIGFKRIRNLTCYNGKLSINQTNKEVNIKKVFEVNFAEIGLLGEIRPTWQNSNETIINLGSDAVYILAYMENELCGYCILNSNNNRILQIGVKHGMRNKHIGSSILQYIKENISDTISIINIDSSFDSVLKFFEKNNLQKSLTQEEMKLKMASG